MNRILSKILVIGAGIAAAASVASCDLTTESPSNFNEMNLFSDPTLTEYQLYSVYNIFGGTNAHRGRYLPWYGYNTDIEWFISSDRGDKSQIAMYDIRVTNTQLNQDNGPYNELYSGIERVNLTINGIRKYGDPQERPEMAALLGEALTLRAVLYAELLKAFGEVPARFEPVTPETIYLNKSDRDVIYKQLLGDLEEAFNYMAWPGQSAATSTTARASLALAKGLYARLALMASGLAQRPAEGMVGTGDQGSVRYTNDPELQKKVLYPKALAALKDIIDNAGLELMDYEQLWRDVNNMDLTAGKEIIWVIPFSEGRGRWNFTFAVRHEPYTEYSPAESSKGGQAGPVPYLYYQYGENDVRRDISCVNYLWKSDSKPYPAGIADWYFGKYRFEWMQAHPYAGGQDDGVKPVYMRYADILLMAAEIANDEACGKRDEGFAKDCLLEVRRRAYKGNEQEAEDYVNSLSGKEAIFNAIVDERALEFVGEFLRKADLIRWGMLKSKMDEAVRELQAFRDASPDSPKGIDYSTLGTYCWYRHGTDAYGVPTIEMYGIHPGENLATDTTPPPTGTGWVPYTSSSGNVSRYFVSSAEAGDDPKSAAFYAGDKKEIDKASAAGGFYVNDPDTKQWWPIFQISITNGQGYLKNDYGY